MMRGFTSNGDHPRRDRDRSRLRGRTAVLGQPVQEHASDDDHRLRDRRWRRPGRRGDPGQPLGQPADRGGDRRARRRRSSGLFVLAGATPAALGPAGRHLGTLPARPWRDHGPVLRVPGHRPDRRRPHRRLRGGHAWHRRDAHRDRRPAGRRPHPAGAAARAGAPAGWRGPRRAQAQTRGQARPPRTPGRDRRAALDAGPAGPRQPRRGRRATPPRDGRGPVDPAGGRLGGRCRDRHERRPGRRHAERLRDRRRRVLAHLGRGAGRQTALNGSGRAPAAADAGALAGGGPHGAAAVRAADHHRTGRRPVVGRRPCPSRPPGPRDDPGSGHRAGTERVPGVGRVHRRGGGDRAARPRVTRPGCRVLRRLSAARPAVAPGRARPPAGAGRDAGDARYRGLRCVLRRRPRRAAGARPGGGRQPDRLGRPAGPHLHLGRPDRDRLSRRPGHDPPAQQLRAGRPRDPGHPGAVRGAAGLGVRTGRRHRPGLDPPRHRGVQAGDGGPRRVPDRPGVPRRPGRAAPGRGPHRRARRTDRPAPGRPRTRRHQPARRRHDLPRDRGRARATRSA